MKSSLAADALIAIVDDDELVGASLASLFRSFGVKAEAFESAACFLSGDPDRFDLVVCDLHMPGMNGLELRRILNEREAPLPMIMITAFPERARDWARADKDLLVLEKPVDSARLISCIEMALERPIN